MSDYTLKLKIIRTEFNTIKADTNYFELNSKAKKLVDDLVEAFEENMTVMQNLVTDVQNVNPDGTYYTKGAIDVKFDELDELTSIFWDYFNELAEDKNINEQSFKKLFDKSQEFTNNLLGLDKAIIEIQNKAIQDRIVSSQSLEYTAEFIRQTHNTGILNLNSSGIALPKPYQKPIDTNYSALNIHNHPNYANMAGMGWYTFIANGYMGQTRHNDYMTDTKGVGFMEKIRLEAPSVPNYHYTIANMQDLFKRYLSKNLTNNEKEYFRWDMAYLESWWQKVDTLNGIVGDTFGSFRHTFGNTKPTYLANMFTTSRATGKKDRFENIPFFPIASKVVDSNGKSVYSVFMYRILVAPLIHLNGKKWDEVMELKDDLVNRARFGTITELKYQAKFRLKDNLLEPAINTIPSLGGLDEQITDYKTIDGHDVISPPDKARYHRIYQMGSDAVGRSAYTNGWNDPTLIVGYTKQSEIVKGTSYLLPLEMILRTPLETWNPNDLEIGTVTGNGTEANPYTKMNPNGYNYHTPNIFYDGMTTVDPADTGVGVKAMKNIRGEISLNVASGIYINLPQINGIDERVRTRFPINWTSTEFSLNNTMLDAYRQEMDEVTAVLFLNALGE
jgi:hypothetical protein